jgi:transcriptional regulator GlxA family with amidase domain
MDEVLNNKSLMNYVRKHAEKGAWLSSNCSGAMVLAQAGVLDGKRATTYAGGEAKMQRKYPEVKVQTDQNVVVDGKFVTTNGSLVSYQGALTLLKLMSSQRKADEVAEVLQYSRFSQAKY